MSRVPWREGKVVSIETRRGVFALGQMLRPPYMMFFNVFHSSHDWPKIKLADVPTLYCLPVVRHFISASNSQYQKHLSPVQFKSYPNRWISIKGNAVYRTIWTATPLETTVVYMGEEGGALIEKDILASYEDAWKSLRVIIKRIRFDDTETIDKHELDTFGLHPVENERLYLCHLFGKNVNPYKDLIFERPLPPEYEQYMSLLKVSDKTLANLNAGVLRVDKPVRTKKRK